MLGRTTARRAALGLRRCCACGYCGHFSQLGPERAKAGGAHCPRCGCDFSSRPPRSYAEMEGLNLIDPSWDDLTLGSRQRPLTPGDIRLMEAKVVERWLAFLFFLALAVAAMLGLVAQLMAPAANG